MYIVHYIMYILYNVKCVYCNLYIYNIQCEFILIYYIYIYIYIYIQTTYTPVSDICIVHISVYCTLYTFMYM